MAWPELGMDITEEGSCVHQCFELWLVPREKKKQWMDTGDTRQIILFQQIKTDTVHSSNITFIAR